MSVRPYADQALREIARRLLGPVVAKGTLDEALPPNHPAKTAQLAAWGQVVRYLERRLQTAPHPSGRAPDVSLPAGAAMRAVLREMAREAA